MSIDEAYALGKKMSGEEVMTALVAEMSMQTW
jgi:hypothetical protein